MDRSQVSLEDVGPVEALFYRRARARAETAYHGTLVMGQGVSILVVFSRKAFLIVLTVQDWTFFWPFRLMCQHMGFQILEDSAAVGMRTSPLFLDLCIVLCTSRHGTLSRLP